MNTSDLISLAPFLIIAAATVTVLLVIAFRRHHGIVLSLTVSGFVLALGAIWITAQLPDRSITELFRVDLFAQFFTVLILAAGLAVSLLAYSYFRRLPEQHEEFYVLLLSACLGAMVLTASIHFASFFLGLEILTVSLYAMIAYVRTSDQGLEAGLKYLMLAAVSSAFILLGMALVYAGSGSMSFATLLRGPAAEEPIFLSVGIGMIFVGVGFKLALVPFHLWTADVYEGAPAPVTAFIATSSKTAVFAVLLRFLAAADLRPASPLFLALTLLALLSMLAGSFLGLLQRNVKRLLAYSSITHAGYVIVALLAGGAAGRESAAFYLAVYVATTLGAFGVVSMLSGSDGDATTEEHYQGLAWRRPWMALILSIMLLSLAGLPITGGFTGKFFLVTAGVGASLWVPVAALVVSSIIGLFYYLRLLALLFAGPGDRIPVPGQISAAGSAVLTVLLYVVIWMGILPGTFLDAVQAAMR